ncbi:MAG: AEC family transporter [Gammaproteobacteria bacterium]|nr:AEC family transporter [Gammaproteobacteria bacterium]
MNLQFTDVVFAIAPIFMLMIIGNLLRRNQILDEAFWSLNDKLVYWILLPALLFNEISKIHFSPALFGSYATVILGGFFGVILLSILLSKVFGYSGVISSSVMQGAARHNAFIALAISGSLFGAQGLAIGASLMAILIPVVNVVIVTFMVIVLQDTKLDKVKPKLTGVVAELSKNPLILAIVVGFVFSVAGAKDVPIIHETTRLLGLGAIPVLLLGLGANIKIRNLSIKISPLIISCVLKLAIFPLIVYLVSDYYFAFSVTEKIVLVIFSCVPTAVSSYTLAKQLGGETELMTSIITLQTALSFVTIPLVLAIIT